MTETPVLPAVPNMAEAFGDESQCAAKVAYLWREIDTLAHYPASTQTVVELLRQGGGWDVSAELLEDWARRGMVRGVAIRSGRYAWSAANILTAAVQADTWRRFIPLHPAHLHKLSGVELAEMQAAAVGETSFTDLGMYDVCAMLTMVTNCPDEKIRHVFGVALRTKLQQLNVLDK